jgi:succinate dehydrogenase / fumarate reductase cytochrome b subunit
VETRLPQSFRFYQATIGKKVVMAVTGVILFGFIVGHLAGNLQIFLGPEKLDDYAKFLREKPSVLWAARIVLLVSVILHIVSSIQLTLIKNAARPEGYRKKQNIGSTYASRTMMWSGPIVAAFVVYHLMHFTWGTAHPTYPNFDQHHVYRNVVTGFQSPAVSIAYIVAMVLLGMHLFHGLWSMFQTLGVNHPRYNPVLRRFAAIATIVIVAGNISIPLAVLTGLVQ